MRKLLLFCTLFILTVNVAQAQDTVGPDSYPPGVNPLTGLTVDQPDNLNRRPLIVKIDNYPPEIRPQSGLMQADIVWEHLLSGGVTRFAAIYLSSDVDHLGPVRSSRLVDFDLVRIYRALFAYSGMAEGTLDILRGDSVALSRAVTGPCPALCRFPSKTLAYEHTLYGDTTALRDLADQLGRDTTPEPIYGMAFDQAAPSAGTALSEIQVAYRQTEVTWDYDAASGRWLRSQDGAPHMDATSGEQISAANVLVLEADHIEQPFVSENYWGPGDYAFSVPLINSGRVFLLRDGQYVEGEWHRAQRTDPLTYTDLAGNHARLQARQHLCRIGAALDQRFRIDLHAQPADHRDDHGGDRRESAHGSRRGLYLDRRCARRTPGDGNRSQWQRRLGATAAAG